MYLIDATYFTQPPLEIAEADGTSNTRDGAKTILEGYGDEKPRDILTDALGFELADTLESFTTGGELNNDAPEIWQKLVYGTTYTYKNEDYKWDGLIFEKGIVKKSLLASYTYFNYKKDTNTQTTGSGEVVIITKNAQNRNDGQKYVNAYNSFLEMYQGDYLPKYSDFRLTYLDRFQRRSYPYYDALNGCYCNSRKNANKVVSLLTFLDQNSEDYPDAALTSQGDCGTPANIMSI